VLLRSTVATAIRGALAAAEVPAREIIHPSLPGADDMGATEGDVGPAKDSEEDWVRISMCLV